MTHEKWTQHTRSAPPPIAGELATDYRARAAAVEYEARERRRQELAEQVAVQNTPEQRIRVWERLHELNLPKKGTHPLVRIIAADTELTVEQVREEQDRRLAPVKHEPVIATPSLPPRF
ncbi:MAG TPA: hypothetical protein VEZ88_08785 [Steroidobacteraceae bacterium]|nr:hypothetical protein [Steroidobacteraceae bacterium]